MKEVFCVVWGNCGEEGVTVEVGGDFGLVDAGDFGGGEGVGEDLGAADDEDFFARGESESVVEVAGDFGARSWVVDLGSQDDVLAIW